MRKAPVDLSYKLKGKILLSLNKHDKSQPLSIRKTFLKWYLNSHENKFSKQIYNIWLMGSVSKFTAFMRLKNIIDLNKKQKVSRPLKEFLKVLCQRFDHYQSHNQKHFLSQWVRNNRRIRKINQTLGMLDNATLETQQELQHFALQRLVENGRKKKFIHHYLQKYLITHTQKYEAVVDKLKALPKRKKILGKAMLRNILQRVHLKSEESERRVMEIFLKNRQVGHYKKIIFLSKAFARDEAYKQKYLQIWFNTVRSIAQEESLN